MGDCTKNWETIGKIMKKSWNLFQGGTPIYMYCIKGEDARREISIEPLKGTNLGMA